MDNKTELMIITMEECGELTQACSKVLRTDFSKETIEDLTKEVADVMCMIELIKEHLYIKHSDIVQGIQKKRDKLKIWSNLINES